MTLQNFPRWHCPACDWNGHEPGEREPDPLDPEDIHERCCPMCDFVEIQRIIQGHLPNKEKKDGP